MLYIYTLLYIYNILCIYIWWYKDLIGFKIWHVDNSGFFLVLIYVPSNTHHVCASSNIYKANVYPTLGIIRLYHTDHSAT